MKPIKGFSKLTKVEKLNYIVENYLDASKHKLEEIKSFWHSNAQAQQILDDFSENTVSNFFFPYGVVPNFKLNENLYCVPMVIEESSVVAACARSANFWLSRGGFKAEIIGTEKIGQVHFSWKGESSKLIKFFNESAKELLLNEVAPLLTNMEQRGGGLNSLELRDCTDREDDYYQLWATFETCDAMGANFINSVLEALGQKLRTLVSENESFNESEKDLLVIMAILSNYTPNCRVKAMVECPVEDLEDKSLGMSAELFATKMRKAVRIAEIDVNRATTHNKGIFNGIDALILATGNDFRAIEACGHTYAARDGQYRSLTHCEIENGIFRFWIDIPLALGTVGGLTKLHPMAKLSLDMLNKPSAKELMMIVAACGLAQNFGALRSLVTSGIQKGHMKMHLVNILNQLEASEQEREIVRAKFQDRIVSYKDVREELASLRDLQ